MTATGRPYLGRRWLRLRPPARRRLSPSHLTAPPLSAVSVSAPRLACDSSAVVAAAISSGVAPALTFASNSSALSCCICATGSDCRAKSSALVAAAISSGVAPAFTVSNRSRATVSDSSPLVTSALAELHGLVVESLAQVRSRKR